MVVGMIVGAVIALFCFLSGYYLGAKGYCVGYKELDVSNDFEAEPVIMPETKNVGEVSNTQNKTVDLFRTDRGLLSYKKYVRSE
jgi:hypothetical protein